ncbi:5-formyltetrahydrofolate cyclo-ligase [Coxiella endosymbiont of Amblyomma sculptum]|uniref:5-formyltetrahydrofolate cyclo-ligase n=1 Tax=Coxiella endosymbiont of Amblyomma sculptum TaxID=2487929 RepID=UPI00132EAA66|nr:5-formyltetrahydrofolate cyclo-ligase [Coxiella endosymbiont of Amblyomma sculptum]QHG92400.1 5-formyltetrahydrofolate cyclo-ligase [Coxiella endosymbiont of Amblyomma sculptum]
MSFHKEKLRVLFNRRRGSLSLRERTSASRQICRKIITLHFFNLSQNLAFYKAYNGEVNINIVLTKAQKMGKNCYLPVLHKQCLIFYSYTRNTLVKNHFDIEEPDVSQEKSIYLNNLDLIFLPLVAFDEKGHRLGRGGGHYDQSLKSLKNQYLKKPVLIGVSYECQRINKIPVERWDIPLDLVITEKTIYQFS